MLVASEAGGLVATAHLEAVPIPLVGMKWMRPLGEMAQLARLVSPSLPDLEVDPVDGPIPA